MAVIDIVTVVAAPPAVVFDLARSIDLHVESQGRHRERAVGGRTSGLIRAGEQVTWEAVHFGLGQRLTSRVTVFDPPHHFRDEQVDGIFRHFVHDHWFEATEAGTRMRDRIDYAAPLGPLGRLAEWLAVTRHLRRLLHDRARCIRDAAEGAIPIA